MKKALIVLLLLSTSTLFAARNELTSRVILTQSVNVDGTTLERGDYASEEAYAQALHTAGLSGGEIIAMFGAALAAVIGIAIGASNKNDESKGSGHRTHASDPS